MRSWKHCGERCPNGVCLSRQSPDGWVGIGCVCAELSVERFLWVEFAVIRSSWAGDWVCVIHTRGTCTRVHCNRRFSVAGVLEMALRFSNGKLLELFCRAAFPPASIAADDEGGMYIFVCMCVCLCVFLVRICEHFLESPRLALCNALAVLLARFIRDCPRRTSEKREKKNHTFDAFCKKNCCTPFFETIFGTLQVTPTGLSAVWPAFSWCLSLLRRSCRTCWRRLENSDQIDLNKPSHTWPRMPRTSCPHNGAANTSATPLLPLPAAHNLSLSL